MGYSQIADHAAMVFDDVRNSAYGDALRQSIAPDSVVLDLGAGLGIHGLIAAAAGARRVYMVDPEPVVLAALEVARSQGFGDCVVAMQSRIEDVELPEKVDIIASVLTGNLLFSEDLLPSLMAARDRFLRPGGKLIPDQAQLIVAPVCAPLLHDRFIGRWGRPVMGLDYSKMRPLSANEVIPLFRQDVADCSLIGEGAPLCALDLRSAHSADASGAVCIRATVASPCHGFLGWVRMRLGDSWLDAGPSSPAVHWTPMYLPVETPLHIEAGTMVEISLKRPAYGDWAWRMESGGESRTQSTFLSSVDGPAQWLRSAPQAAPGLSKAGNIALEVLGGIARHRVLSDVALELAASQGISEDEALRMVQYFARRFGATA